MRAKILSASAGSGKTYQLAYKYVRDVIEVPERYRHILAVTFTNKATEEMKSRILKEIHLLASDKKSSYLENLCNELNLDAQTVRKRASAARSKILHDYSRFTVLTIDTFFQRILRAFIKELGIDLNYNIEIETASILTKSADTLIEQITTDHDLQRWLTDFVQERIDENKKWDVREGILSLGGELFKESNKTALSLARSREELGRIVGEAAAQTTLTKKEIRQIASAAVDIINRAGLTLADFPYKDKGFAAWFYSVASGSLPQYGARVDAACTKDEAWGKAGTPSQGLREELQPLLRSMCEIYDKNIRAWNTCDLLRENYRSFALLADLYAKVQQMCDEQNMMILSETKYILSEFISESDAPFIYEKVGNRFDYFMIDEFQDTSSKEWENFLPLLKNAMSQNEGSSVLIVGDIKQSIYRWRGGDWKILHNEAKEALGNDTEVVALKDNWRSLPAIVDFNNRIIEKIVSIDNRALNEILDSGGVAPEIASELRNTLQDAYKGHSQIPRRKSSRTGYISISTFDEKPPIVERICEILEKGFRPCDILILVRGARDGAKVAAELLEFKNRNSDPRYRFDVMTQEALVVGNSPISAFIIAALRLSLNAEDSLNRALYNHYLGKDFGRELSIDDQDFFRSIRLLSPEEAFERIVMRHNLQNSGGQIAYLQAIHEQIINFCSTKIADISLFLEWWEQTGQNRSLSIEQSERTVEITTIHKAKGLEKPVVIIPYCSWQLDPKSSGNVTNIVWSEAENIGRFPVKYKKTMAQSAFSSEYYRELVYTHVDNINLLYVALTRASESLHIFVPYETKKLTVGTLLLQSIEDIEGDFAGRHCVTDEGERFEFGEFESPVEIAGHIINDKEMGDSRLRGNDVEGADKRGTEHIILDNYPTARANMRLRLPSQRYFEQEDEIELSPRNFGILMHKVFEQADNEEDITHAINQMRSDGVISEREADTLRSMIARSLENPVAQSWFDGSWERVRNENEIIIPSSDSAGGSTRRPDRVMISGDKAIVVEYKFGERDAERYRQQVSDYLCLLQKMGYKEVEGYLWYVKMGKIEKIQNSKFKIQN